jgi:tRNA guanosine-2'-O-methyltransferase
VDNRNGRAVTLGVVRFIMNAGGRLFQSAIMYLLDGLIQGLKARLEKTPSHSKFATSEIEEILSLARLTGLAEVASDLHSVQCRKLCDLVCSDLGSLNLPTDEVLRARCQKLEQPVDRIALPEDPSSGDLSSLQSCLEKMRESKHKSIQGPAFAPSCKSLVKLLDQEKAASIDPQDLHDVLAALWEEAEIRDFIRPFAVHLPPLLFHPTCVRVCVERSERPVADEENDLEILLSKAMRRLQKLSKGRSYVLAVLARSLRKAVFAHSLITFLLPFDEFILDFVNEPASIRTEFLFEVAAAEKLQQFFPHRTYTSYYGLREWHAYAAMIDLLRRLPRYQLSTAKRILNSLVEPWKIQQPPVAVKSPWKKTLQLQAMLLLCDYCITESNADAYIDALSHALSLESWPRFRYLLEWTLARIYCRFPGKSSRTIAELGDREEYSPIHIASLMKLGLLIAPYESEEFGIKLMTQLNSYSASPKVHIRHEANYAFPLVFDLAIAKGWDSVTSNPAFVEMNAFLRRLDKFSASPWTIRTLKLDIEQDFNLVGIFQGRYLSIESPEGELAMYGDFEALESDDVSTHTDPPPSHVATGEKPLESITVVATPALASQAPALSTVDQAAPTTLQTKAGIDLDNLHPPSGPPSAQNQRPASVMLIASLIDNPTNLGGLSRLSESFGLEALYIDDLKKVAHKDFKTTSVRSEKHLCIRELKEVNIPAFLLEAKSNGYEVVGIEQTDRSGILGEESTSGSRSQDIGTLPKKCCLVLGSEKEGISAEVLSVIDRNVEIKTVGVTRSLSKLIEQALRGPSGYIKIIC